MASNLSLWEHQNTSTRWNKSGKDISGKKIIQKILFSQIRENLLSCTEVVPGLGEVKGKRKCRIFYLGHKKCFLPYSKKYFRSKIPWLPASELASSSVHYSFPFSSFSPLSGFSSCYFLLLLESASSFSPVAN